MQLKVVGRLIICVNKERSIKYTFKNEFNHVYITDLQNEEQVPAKLVEVVAWSLVLAATPL